MGKNVRGMLVFFLLGLVLFNPVFADSFETKKETKNPIYPSRLKDFSIKRVVQTEEESVCGNWNCFLLGAGAMFDSEGGGAGALSFSYIPNHYLSSSLTLKGYLGAILSNVFVGSGFGIGDFAVTLKYDILPTFSFEVGGGMQYWTGTRLRNTFPQVKAALGFDVFQISYASVMDPILTTHQILGAIFVSI